jgi:tetratricopeptide (TPR) repeat protein
MMHKKSTVKSISPVLNFLMFLSMTAILLTGIATNAQKRSPSKTAAVKKSAVASRNITCDSLAAHPEDKNRLGTGVADGKIISRAAIEKCRLAVEQNPDEARFYFQLGRAYWAAKQYDEALEAFLKAEEMEYAPAYYYLGQTYEKGLVEGVKSDAAAARNLYLIAASEGFEPAVRAYRESIGDMPDFSEFKQPELMQALYEGNMEAYKKDVKKALVYAKGIQVFMELKPNEYDATCTELVNYSVGTELEALINKEFFAVNRNPSLLDALQLLQRTLESNGSNITEAARYNPFFEDGTNDIYLLAYDYGTCKGAAVEKVYSTVKRFVN